MNSEARDRLVLKYSLLIAEYQADLDRFERRVRVLENQVNEWRDWSPGVNHALCQLANQIYKLGARLEALEISDGEDNGNL
jgi:hypothetical protein